MLIALIWWSVLLYSKNEELYQVKSQLSEIAADRGSQNMDAVTKKYNRQKGMIIGEGLVFGIMLVIGILLIIRSYNRELYVAQKENNFLLSITHELKSPIASIQLILDTFKKRELKKEIFDELNENALEETTRLNALVGNLLYANKLNYGQEYHFETYNLSELVSKMSAHFSKAHLEVQLTTQIEDNIYTQIDTDAFKIVLNNLFENALKYSADEKLITITLSQDQKINLKVADQGIGISKEEKKKVFSKFYRVGNEDTRDTKGTGLGLYICNEIIKGHQGHIELLDNKPKGTIFKIILPSYVG